MGINQPQPLLSKPTVKPTVRGVENLVQEDSFYTPEELQSYSLISFNKRLASNDKSVRDKAIQSLSTFLLLNHEKMRQVDYALLWKGIYFNVWMSDKPLVQQQLVEFIGLIVIDLLDKSKDADSDLPDRNTYMFLKTFWMSITKEWTNIDKHRINKYYLLLKSMLNATIYTIKKLNSFEKRFHIVKMLAKNCIHYIFPRGIVFYLLEIYPDCLNEKCVEESENENIDYFYLFTIPLIRTVYLSDNSALDILALQTMNKIIEISAASNINKINKTKIKAILLEIIKQKDCLKKPKELFTAILKEYFDIEKDIIESLTKNNLENITNLKTAKNDMEVHQIVEFIVPSQSPTQKNKNKNSSSSENLNTEKCTDDCASKACNRKKGKVMNFNITENVTNNDKIENKSPIENTNVSPQVNNSFKIIDSPKTNNNTYIKNMVNLENSINSIESLSVKKGITWALDRNQIRNFHKGSPVSPHNNSENIHNNGSTPTRGLLKHQKKNSFDN